MRPSAFRFGIFAVLSCLVLTGCPWWVTPQAKLAVSKTAHDFGETETDWAFRVWNAGDWGSRLTFQISADVDWLTVSPQEGSSRGRLHRVTIHVAVDREAITKAVHTGQITVDSNGGTRVIDIAVTTSAGEGEGEGEGEKMFSMASYYVPYETGVEPGAAGYALPLDDLRSVQYYDIVNAVFGIEAMVPLIEQNGFGIMEFDFSQFVWEQDENDDIITPYQAFEHGDVPIFVTADTLLHLYHVQFDETLKEIEENEFFGDTLDLTAALLADAENHHAKSADERQEAALRNVAYLAVAMKLIDPETTVPELVADDVQAELAKIDAHAGFADSDIFIYAEDYSQYVPRGHYTRSEELERYFRTLMWYGRMAFLLKGAENWGPAGDALISEEDAKIQTIQAVMIAQALNSVQVGERLARDIWERMYAVTSFYVGLADDLTPFEYLGAVKKAFGSLFELADLDDEAKFHDLKTELALLRSPEIFGGTGNAMVTPPVTPETLQELLDKTKGMRLMGQRFIPDSYMFQQLVFPQVEDYTGGGYPFTLGWTGLRWGRCYPRGLDVMTILGSSLAEAILVEEGDTDYIYHARQLQKLEDQFAEFGVPEWNRNLYWSWLYTLQALLGDFGDGYPAFMQTEAWRKKELNAALASWTELRHDTILYAK